MATLRAPKPAVGKKVAVPVTRAPTIRPTMPNSPKPAPVQHYNPAQSGALTGANKQYQVTDPIILPGYSGLSPAQQAAYKLYFQDPNRDRRVTVLPQMWAQLAGGNAAPGTFGQPGVGTGTGPAAPTATPMPWDTQYETTVSGINKNRDLGHQDIHAQQVNLSHDSGYSYDPATGNIGIDTTDPFSRRQLLVQNYARARTGSTNSMAARGQLYSGALQNAQNFNTTNYLQDDNTAKNTYRDQALGLLRQDTGIDTAADQAISDAGGTRLNTAIANAQANPQDPGVAPKPSKPLGGLPSNAGGSVASQLAWLKSHPKWLASTDGKKWAAGHPVAIGALK